MVRPQHMRPLDQPARHGEDQRHRHVGGVLGQHARRVGDGYAARQGLLDVDMVEAVREAGDQLQLLARLGEDGAVDAVGDGRHQHVGHFHCLDQLGRRHRPVVDVELSVEQFAHARLDRVGQPARDDDQRLLLHRGLPVESSLTMERQTMRVGWCTPSLRIAIPYQTARRSQPYRWSGFRESTSGRSNGR